MYVNFLKTVARRKSKTGPTNDDSYPTSIKLGPHYLDSGHELDRDHDRDGNSDERDDLSTRNDSDNFLPSSSGVTMNHLPDLVMVHIFSFLPVYEKVKVELVSERWGELSRLSWSSVTEFPNYNFPFPLYNLPFPNHDSQIRDGLFDDVKGDDGGDGLDAGLDALFLRLLLRMRHRTKNVTRLKKLGSTFPRRPIPPLGDRGFRAIGRLCPRLETIVIRQESVSAAQLRRIGEGCPRLKELVTRAEDLTDEAVSQIALRCSSLTRLDISGSPRITGHFLLYHRAAATIDGYVISDDSFLSSLVSLNLRECVNLTDDAVEPIVKFCAPTLEELDLSKCRRLTAVGLEKIGKLPKLKVLKLSNNFRDVNLPIIFDGGRNRLVTLDISHNFGINDNHMVDILSLLPELETLDIDENKCVTDWFIYKWFNGYTNNTNDHFGERYIGSRKKYFPLTLNCRGTRIGLEKGKKNFTWTLNRTDRASNL